MLYYIYYGYIASITMYKCYEYWEIAKIAYTTCNYTYNKVSVMIKNKSGIVGELEEITVWDMCDDYTYPPVS
jgi:hypothetical protein